MARRFASALLTWLLMGAAQAAPFSAADLEAAAALRDAALAGSGAYEIVASLTTEVGPRPAGSAADRAAVAWAERKFAALGLSNIRRQPVPVPHWERGTIEARTTATITLFIVALWVLAILARPFTFWRFELVGSMAGLFVLALLVPWSRHFFALNMAPPWITACAVGIAAVAAGLLELAWRWTGWLRPVGDAEGEGGT